VIRTPEDVADVVRFLVSDRAGYAVVPPAVSSSGERGGASMELIEHVTEERLRREEAAARLRSLADELSRHNEIAFARAPRRPLIVRLIRRGRMGCHRTGMSHGAPRLRLHGDS
jgi:hypothetical protein